MKEYLKLLRTINTRGTDKPAARSNMPGSRSLFGYQFRHDLSEGFPLLTTKKMFWKGIVIELLWFLRGETNIKFLVDNDVNIWNGDAYNYYLKKCKETGTTDPLYMNGEFGFIEHIKAGSLQPNTRGLAASGYQYGDCGYQYGKVWRNWQGEGILTGDTSSGDNHIYIDYPAVDQIKKVIKSLTETPESRRHIVTAIDPAHDEDLALYWCHSMFQFNCRPISLLGRCTLMAEPRLTMTEEELDEEGIPKYYLDCQLYQRSADTFLGVPFNLASYSLLTHVIAKIVNMVPGEFIHTFGDAHIYDNHQEAVTEQLLRAPTELPKLYISPVPFSNYHHGNLDLDGLFEKLQFSDFVTENYKAQGPIKAPLSTG